MKENLNGQETAWLGPERWTVTEKKKKKGGSGNTEKIRYKFYPERVTRAWDGP